MVRGGGGGGWGRQPWIRHCLLYLYLHFIPGFVSDFTGGRVRRNSGRCGHGTSGKTDSRPEQEMKIQRSATFDRRLPHPSGTSVTLTFVDEINTLGPAYNE